MFYKMIDLWDELIASWILKKILYTCQRGRSATFNLWLILNYIAEHVYQIIDRIQKT